MTEKASIWRADEGRSTDTQPGPPQSTPDLFGPPVPQAPPGQAEKVDLWRTDEGKPSQKVRLPSAPPVSAPKRTKKDRSRSETPALISWRKLVVTVVVLLLLALVGDGAYAVLTIRERLGTVADNLRLVEDRLAAGEVETASDHSDAALDEAISAEAATDRPSLFLASMIPEVKRETEAIDGAVQASALSAQAAGSIVTAAGTLGLDEDGVPADVYVDGQVQLETVAEARQATNDAELALTAALVELEGLEPRIAQLQAPITDAHTRISDALVRMTDARTSMDLLASLFGLEDERRYLLAFQAPGEARGTGGLVGMVAVLEADDGRLELAEPVPYNEFATAKAQGVEAPGWFKTSYGPQQALREWPQANVSPNAPVVSEVMLDMYEGGTGESLDGVLTMDPLAMQELMAGADPIEVGETTIDATNVAEVLLHDSYTEFATPEQQNRFLGEVVDGFWAQVSGGQIDLEPFAEGLGNAIRGQHFKLYVRKGSDQSNIEALDLDGDYGVGPNSQMVFNVNYAANKVDYFLHRELDTEIELDASGDAQVTTTMRLENGAPNGPASALLGQNNGLEPGVNRMTINMLMPPGSVIDSFSVGGEERSAFTYTDENSPVAWDLLEIAPGGSETVSITYTIPGAVQLLGQATTFDFSLYPQASVNPDSFSLSIEPPPGVEVIDIDGGLSDDETPSLSGTLEEPVSVRLLMEEE